MRSRGNRPAAPRRPRRNPRAGVTLLELLVSLAMMAALALILASTLDVTARGAGRLGAEAQGLAPLLDRATLRRWIEDMPPGAILVGSAERMSFDTLIDAPPFWAGELTRISIERSGEAVRAVALLPSGDIGREILLSEESADFALAYWGRLPSGVGHAWFTEWPPGAGLPDLVRISYDIDGRAAPPLSVRPARAAHHSVMSLSSLSPPG